MAGKILSREEAIALTEKKVAMSLDEIIQMSKKATFKGRKPARAPVANKTRGFVKGGVFQSGPAKMQNFLNSRSAIRQGVLVQRSNFLGNQFPLTTKVAKRAAYLPVQNRVANWNKRRVPVVNSKSGKGQVVLEEHGRPKTLDARFANMKEQRLKMLPQQMKVTNYRRPTAVARQNVSLPLRQRLGQVARRQGNNDGRYFKFANYN